MENVSTSRNILESRPMMTRMGQILRVAPFMTKKTNMMRRYPPPRAKRLRTTMQKIWTTGLAMRDIMMMRCRQLPAFILTHSIWQDKNGGLVVEGVVYEALPLADKSVHRNEHQAEEVMSFQGEGKRRCVVMVVELTNET
jgi:hypothetical protein